MNAAVAPLMPYWMNSFTSADEVDEAERERVRLVGEDLDAWAAASHAVVVAMPVDAFLLALGAAALHAGWNILVARAEDVRAATTVALCLSVVLFAPVAVAHLGVDAAAIPWIVLSAALELAYFLLLTTAYRDSDVSLVYPIARGVAPVLVLVGGWLAGAKLGALQPSESCSSASASCSCAARQATG